LRYDPDSALSELFELGLNPGDIEIEISVLASSSLGRVAEVLQEEWQNLGINATVRPETNFESLQSKRFSAWLLNLSWPPSGEQASRFRTDASENFGGYSNPEYDDLADRAKAEAEPGARFESMRLADEIILEDVPAIFLWYLRGVALVDPTLDGFVPDVRDLFWAVPDLPLPD
jgi:peptide/nickel transport system substrate-binding protein